MPLGGGVYLLRIGGTRHGSDEPWFVSGKIGARNALVVVQGHDDPRLHAVRVDAVEPHWIAGAPPELPAQLAAKTRYRMADASCAVDAHRDGLRATFDRPQFAPTPGQYLVLYDGDVCLGGAVIADSGNAVASADAAEASQFA